MLCFIVFGCQYRCNWLPGKTRFRMTYYVSSGTLNPTHSLTTHIFFFSTFNCILAVPEHIWHFRDKCALEDKPHSLRNRNLSEFFRNWLQKYLWTGLRHELNMCKVSKLPGTLAVELMCFSSAFCCSKLLRAHRGTVTSCSDAMKLILSPIWWLRP